MDLRECSAGNGIRHPWETARLNALRKILAEELPEGGRVLDEGCGDGFIARNLFPSVANREITAVDINLSPEQAALLTASAPGVNFLAANPAGEFDLILLLDVLEHIEDDAGFLGSLAAGTLAEGGKVMITVPAFKSLYSRHDSYLGHHRRYSLRQLHALAKGCKLAVCSSGYLFSSLLLPKLFLFKMFGCGKPVRGVGNWKFGKALTSVLEGAFLLENTLLIEAAKLGLKMPGLSAWALCVKEGKRV